MSDRPATQPVEPDAAVLAAVVAFGCATLQAALQSSALRAGEQMEGFARGFLMQYPSIAKAETAHSLLDRCELRLPDGGLYDDVRKYLSDVEAP